MEKNPKTTFPSIDDSTIRENAEVKEKIMFLIADTRVKYKCFQAVYPSAVNCCQEEYAILFQLLLFPILIYAIG